MSFGRSPSGGRAYDREMFREQEQELERAAERHREETEGEPEPSRFGRLLDRVRTAVRGRDSS